MKNFILGLIIGLSLIGIYSFAQTKATSSEATTLITPLILTDTEKLNIITIEKKQIDNLASKYAMLYDKCKNK